MIAGKKGHNYYTILLTLTIVALFVGCSTKKDKWANRKYHQITAHYNAYWNGAESYEQAQKTIQTTVKDDYTRLLPVFKTADEKNVASVKSSADRSIEKASKVIKKHSMRFSGVEKNPQIDDAYLLIGKSCLISRDFVGAEATFKYIIANWKKSKDMYEPMVWLALTYTKQGKFSESEIVLKEVQKAIDNKKAPKKLKNFMYMVWAENDLAQGRLLPADEKLSLRTNKMFSKTENVRMKFIQGQIYLQTKQYDKAYKAFGYAYSHAQDYQMQFVSKLNQALCFSPGDERSLKVIDELENMLDKEINSEYKDQIYYAIGEIYYRNRNLTIACKKWEESVKSSRSNTTQKIASAIRCADVYYDPLQDYKKACMYYDTALTLMSKDHVDFKRINDRQKVLSSLVENLNIVEKWDSLLALSELSERDLNDKIEQWITAYKIEQKKKEERERLEQAIARQNAQLNSFGQNRNQSSFYFYNPTTVQSGKIEFERRWGKRALEDNWRLEQKEEIGSEQDDALADNDTDSTTEQSQHSKNYTPDMKEYYTKDIPYTQGAKDTAHAQTANALLDAGYIFWQGINNKEKAVETLLELHKRYPTHKNIPPSSYHLYKIYDEMGDYPSSNYYKNKILSEFPQSEFAIMIQNPSMWEDAKKNNSAQDAVYERAYAYYTNKEFRSAIAAANQGIDEIKIGPYIPRLMYISALAKGKLYGADSLADNLNMIIYNYPNSEVAPIIERQLQYLAENYDIKELVKYDKKREEEYKRMQQTVADSVVNGITDSVNRDVVNRDDILDAESLVFRYKDGVHYFVMLADDSKFDAEQLQENFNSFNERKFEKDNLTVSANLFTSTYQILSVRKFANMDMAFSYMDSVMQDSVFKTYNDSYYKCFIISMQNYATFYAKRNIPAYEKFFKIMYIGNREKSENESEPQNKEPKN